MLSEEKLARLNALAKKKREIGLSPEEQSEQGQLREQYLAAFRGRFAAQLEDLGLEKVQKDCPCCKH
ncbi:MAG: DUF896 domain-containing protein [Peptococcaceae bacterium]|nr:DUF896 domain-containing protein [Peptococcaceae bacterium]MBT9157514.1 hypothetical protein [Bacillota bacterium]